ncbi:hypothetical protein [Tepidibacter formicigenes]|jgi:hypothetical protein|uniref:Uncharacterized protein n=1 Tax=Tepidibacter formicigenes DSM 15518 TaxID=1123349 RepID=A0A1M6SX71_9FIRM|nr:hypothetical protein [Tepidibacter formicigenes]SHK49286.1 hypothetical protein SAMN02744037_02451 [Tepidibacter formicigenes DSM 15518]
MKAKNPKEIIEDTYDTTKYKAPERPLTGFVMPLNMKRDFDYIDPMRFSEYRPFIPDDEDANKEELRKKTR